jgi:lipopolysaccharide transport system ATP-binding protein
MSHPVISVENLSKSYRLGQIGTGTLSRDLKVWWARTRGKPNPLLRIGQTDHGNRTGEILWALTDVSFHVEQGEVLGIIGRNGAGKSTLLKILSRVTAPTSGCVNVKGRIASLLEVGTGFHPELTGRENIYLNGAILGMTKEEVRRRFDEIVAFAEIEKFIDTPVKRYSSGMYVRLAFAVAAHLESEILLVDEVLAVGDVEFQRKCLGKMEDAAIKEGRTVLFVSHNLAAIKNLCSHGLFFKGGYIQTDGDISKVITNYLNSDNNVSWTNYGLTSNEIHLTQINIFQEGRSKYRFLTELPLNIEFNYQIKKKEVSGLRIGFDLLTSDGVTIFRSFDDDIIKQHLRKQGRYKSICVIPSNFFLGTDYFLHPRIGIHYGRWISDNNTRIKISFDHLSGVNQGYGDQRPGIIMPELKWRTNTYD